MKTVESLEAKVVEERKVLNQKEQLVYMELEDALSIAMRWESRLIHSQQTIKQMDSQLSHNVTEIIELNFKIDDLKEYNMNLQEKLEEYEMILDEYKELFYEIQTQKDQLDIEFKETYESLKNLESESNK